MNKLIKISEHEKKLSTGEAVAELPRQIIRDVASGRIISNAIVPPVSFPAYLIQRTETNIFYNDVDVQRLLREVRTQASSVIKEIRSADFQVAGEKYQQFLDQFASCMESPTELYLHDVKTRGVDLYASLERQVRTLGNSILPENPADEEVEKRFNAVVEANLNLFFHMLIINLAMSNRIDDTTGVLRQKLASLEVILHDLLNRFALAQPDGSRHRLGEDIHNGKTIYGWILLKKGDLYLAKSLYDYHEIIKKQMTFDELFKNVMSLINIPRKRFNEILTFNQVMNEDFGREGLPDSRVRIALQLAYYLQQCETIRGYMDELTNGSSDQISCAPDIDVKSLLTSSDG